MMASNAGLPARTLPNLETATACATRRGDDIYQSLQILNLDAPFNLNTPLPALPPRAARMMIMAAPPVKTPHGPWVLANRAMPRSGNGRGHDATLMPKAHTPTHEASGMRRQAVFNGLHLVWQQQQRDQFAESVFANSVTKTC
ncbi:predicted protein [Plenodomus lingam JN3]|uniref:Predicted protein n=1 Tax=Leptosphaeria maculans (strain JN3 / isolate v23.1.3 / race Av1-4-5-6-7-8) TaxID=985895 RepID=E5AAI3_LEPMJ|nr:predicted protein [Plenodomus lingam JN3]CBY00674.1 predicted protein [Plenodomus lingam JN3]